MLAAVAGLGGHSICLCKNGKTITRDERGIAPMMNLIAEGENLEGYCCADLIVGKAAAMLFVKAKIAAVHARVLSVAGREFLQKYGVPVTCDELTQEIRNRAGTGMCPMEQTVQDVDDVEVAYLKLAAKCEEMKNARK